MKLRAEILEAGQRAAEFLVDRARLQRAEADAHLRHGGAERREKLPQAATIVPFPAPRGDLDAVDHDLAIALGGELPRLLHRAFQRQRAHAPACIRDDAVGAEIVAAVLNLQKRARPLGKAACGKLLKAARKPRVLHMLPVLPVARRLRQTVEKFHAPVRADEHVHVHPAQLLRRGLRVAAAHADDGLRVAPADTADGVARFFVGHGRHGAGIDHITVADAVKVAQRVAALEQKLLHCLCFVLIDLTSQGIKCIFHEQYHQILESRKKKFIAFYG